MTEGQRKEAAKAAARAAKKQQRLQSESTKAIIDAAMSKQKSGFYGISAGLMGNILKNAGPLKHIMPDLGYAIKNGKVALPTMSFHMMGDALKGLYVRGLSPNRCTFTYALPMYDDYLGTFEVEMSAEALMAKMRTGALVFKLTDTFCKPQVGSDPRDKFLPIVATIL